MTEKQTAFIRSLMTQKQLAPEIAERLTKRLEANDLDGRDASKTIEWLLAQPDAANLPTLSKLSELESKVPEGRYALRLAKPDAAGNTVHFYRVDKPDEKSKWYGRTFVSLEIGGREPVAVRDFAQRERILEEIAQNPSEALLRYGQLIGRCGHCGRTLTNDESREIGIGPVCLKKDGARWGL